MWEPRGHADMYGAVVTEPVTPDGDLGVLFLHNEGLSTMCGHGIIALATVAVETGLVPARQPETRIAFDTPAGRVTAFVRRNGKTCRVCGVRFHNVPSFVAALGETVRVPRLGRGADSRNVCVFAEGEVDRSPTGTGVSGRVAIHYARGELKLAERTVIESIVGSRFTGRAVEEVGFGRYRAVIPEVAGSAHITGRHEFLFDPADPFRAGFFMR